MKKLQTISPMPPKKNKKQPHIRTYLTILPQPDDTTCGPTSLHAIYNYYNDTISLEEVVKEVRQFKEGGTLAVFLACHALKRGYSATIYTYNLQIFDPTWFSSKGIDIAERLRMQSEVKTNEKLRKETEGYLEFLSLGGIIKFKDLSAKLIKKYLFNRVPILTGLSATYLYKSKREAGRGCMPDDIQGAPSGHFVVLYGYDRDGKRVLVADPYLQNPLSDDSYYRVAVHRLINSILLGIVTYDANLLIIEKRRAGEIYEGFTGR